MRLSPSHKLLLTLVIFVPPIAVFASTIFMPVVALGLWDPLSQLFEPRALESIGWAAVLALGAGFAVLHLGLFCCSSSTLSPTSPHPFSCASLSQPAFSSSPRPPWWGTFCSISFPMHLPPGSSRSRLPQGKERSISPTNHQTLVACTGME